MKRKLSNNDIWTYTDDLITKNGLVYQLNHDEGRVTLDYAANKWVYEYDYRDHQGNLRLSFRDSLVAGKPPVVTQANDYDPWGMSLSADYQGVSKNNFKYSNREKLDDFGLGVYSLGARMYDPIVPRFWSTDPLIEVGQHAYTPYHYSFNNPIRFNDPDGLLGESCCGDDPDGLGNGMTLVENIYWGTRDALVSSIATVGTFIGSVFSDKVKTQRVNADYSSGERKLTAEVVPKSEVAAEVVGSVVTLAAAVPSGGSAGTGMLMAKTGTKTAAASSLVRFGQKAESVEDLAKQAANAEATPGFGHGVSTKKVDKVSGSYKLHKSAKTSEVEKVFEVKKTGNDPRHHTVILPKPVTQKVADLFNELFQLF